VIEHAISRALAIILVIAAVALLLQYRLPSLTSVGADAWGVVVLLAL